MSSKNDLFGPEDFENLIAAVESLDIPSDDDSSTSTAFNSYSDNVVDLPTDANSIDSSFEIDGNPFGNKSKEMQLEMIDNDDLNELDELMTDYDELNFDDSPAVPDTYSPTASFTPPSKSPRVRAQSANAHKAGSSQVSSFAVDDPFASSNGPTNTGSVANKPAINDEDELFDVYAEFLDAHDEEPNPVTAPDAPGDEFSELASLSLEGAPPAQELDYFGDDGFVSFDGVAAANEISELWNEDPNGIQQQATSKGTNDALHNQPVENKPLHSTMEKTKLAANKLKAHLESLSTPAQPTATNPTFKSAENNSQELSLNDATAGEIDDEFAELSSHAARENHCAPAKVAPVEKPVEETSQVLSEAVSEKVKETIVLNRKTEVISDNMLAAFVDSPLTSKQKVRFFSLQNFAQKLPRVYLACTTLFALAGFAYILAIPALLVITMINGFEMLDSPFTNNMLMLLLALFSISLFLFMVGYKLMDLKFVGPGGITLNHENASTLIDKIQQLQQQRAIPKIHDIVLTRRHELNLIKIPRFGLPVWSKNVLAIGYPLLQTLPAEYFDVALSRRLTQFSKRKNLLHNWLSFMRRTWTIYAVSLKDRKSVIDLLHYCFFAPYACFYRSFAVYISQKDELLADEKALQHCNDRDLMKTAQTLRITRAMLLQYFWPKLNEELQSNTATPYYVQPYSKLPETLNTLLRSKNVDAWFIRLGQEETNPGDSEAPFALRMHALAQRKVAIPDAFNTSAAQHYFGDQYDKMTDLLNTLWAEDVQKELFEKNIHDGKTETLLPCHLAIEPA